MVIQNTVLPYPVSKDLRLAVHKLDLQKKLKPQQGLVSWRGFENEHIGLKSTLFHSVDIPFTPFNSGLDYVNQPESTSLVIDWIKLDLDDPANLDGIDLSQKPDDLEASMYLGSAHNWVQLSKFVFTKIDQGYMVSCSAIVDLETQGVGMNEEIDFESIVTCLE